MTHFRLASWGCQDRLLPQRKGDSALVAVRAIGATPIEEIERSRPLIPRFAFTALILACCRWRYVMERAHSLS
jgi:hypothetical protein